MQTAYERLAEAIVIQAIKDYQKALEELNKNKKDSIALHTIQEVETFIRSEWFEDLSDLNGEYLIKGLQNDIKV